MFCDVFRPYIAFPNHIELRGARLQYAAWSPTGHKLVTVF